MLDPNISVLILESDLNFSVEIEKLIEEIGYQVVANVTDFNAALEVIKQQVPDLILLNFDLQEQHYFADGLAYIHELNIPVIFLSNLPEFQLLNHETKNTIGYLLKPVDKFSLKTSIANTVQSVIKKSNGIYNNQPFSLDDHLFFKEKGEYKKINVNDIYFFKANGDYSQAITFRGEYATSLRMNKLEEVLDKQIFMRIHRSYILNITKINSLVIDENHLDVGGYKIPFSRRYKSELVKRLPIL